MTIPGSLGSVAIPERLRECIVQAEAACAQIMERLVDKAMNDLAEKSVASTVVADRNRLDEAVIAMETQRAIWIKNFGPMLRTGIEADFNTGTKAAAADNKSSGKSLSLDDLSLMDDSVVQTKIQSARMQQSTILVCERELAELDTLVSAARGLTTVSPESNPFRPQIFVDTISQLIDRSQGTPEMRALWSQHVGTGLGHELKALYKKFTEQLMAQGVQAASYRVVPLVVGGMGGGGYVGGGGGGVAGAGGPTGAAAMQTGAVPAGMMAVPAGMVPVGTPMMPAGMPMGAMGAMGAMQGGVPMMPGMVPAAGMPMMGGGMPMMAGAPMVYTDVMDMRAMAMDARMAMMQLKQVMAGQAPTVAPSVPIPVAPPAGMSEQEELAMLMRDIEEANQLMLQIQQLGMLPGMMPVNSQMGQTTPGQTIPGQATQQPKLPDDISIGGQVRRMLDEAIQEQGRVVEPVKQWVMDLQHPLDRLVMRDDSFLKQPEHVVRLLISEVLSRSMAFSSELAPEFEEFFKPLRKFTEVFSTLDRIGSKHFAQALQQLQQIWARAEEEKRLAQERAELEVKQKEERKQLAERIAFELIRRDDAGQAQIFIKQFLTNSWSLVLARARLHPEYPSDAQRYLDAVAELLWSSNPKQASLDKRRLMRIVPGLLETLRAGLASVSLLDERGEQFIAELIKQHEAALEMKVDLALAAAAQKTAPVSAPAPIAAQSARVSAPVPVSAPASSPAPVVSAVEEDFADTDWNMDDDDEILVAPPSGLSQLAPVDDSVLDESLKTSGAVSAQQMASTQPVHPELPRVGGIVELLQGKKWVRTRLTWSNPQGTLFMFTSEIGAPYSMTKRALDAALGQGKIRF
jgi:hypothetical protein